MSDSKRTTSCPECKSLDVRPYGTADNQREGWATCNSCQYAWVEYDWAEDPYADTPSRIAPDQR